MRLILIVLLVVVCFAEIEIKSVDRDISLTSHVVRIENIVEYQNSGETKVESILYTVPREKYEKLGSLTVVEVESEEFCSITNVLEKGDYYEYVIALPEPLIGGESVDLEFTEVLIKYTSPLPRKIRQSENQKLVFVDTLLFYSPYTCETQSTSVILPSEHNAESYTTDLTASLKGDILSYGPFPDVVATAGEAVEELRVHYQYNQPYLHVSKLLREVEISHWGNLAVEEHYVVHHAGAELQGGFSRLDYQRGYPQSAPASFRGIKARLPLEATDIYFRDRIGNISTSNCVNQGDFLEVEFEQRFPLFGGWKTTFYIGYNLPLGNYMTKEGEEFRLDYTIGTSFSEAPISDFVFKVILPEGSQDERLELPFDGEVKEGREIRKTYFDTFGRTVLVAEKSNLVPEQSEMTFSVVYNFPQKFFWMEPALAISGVFVLCMLLIIGVRIDCSVGETTSDREEEEWGVFDESMEKYVVKNFDREEIYNRYTEEDGSLEDLAEDKKAINQEIGEIMEELAGKAKGKLEKLIRRAEKIEALDGKRFKVLIKLHANQEKQDREEDQRRKDKLYKRQLQLDDKYDSIYDEIMENLNVLK